MLLSHKLHSTHAGAGIQTLVGYFEALREGAALLAYNPNVDREQLRGYVLILEQARPKNRAGAGRRQFDQAWFLLRGLWEHPPGRPARRATGSRAASPGAVDPQRGQQHPRRAETADALEAAKTESDAAHLRSVLAWVKREINESAQVRYWKFNIYQRRVKATAQVLVALLLALTAATVVLLASQGEVWYRQLALLLGVLFAGSLGGAVSGLRTSEEISQQRLSSAYLKQAVTLLRMLVGAAAAAGRLLCPGLRAARRDLWGRGRPGPGLPGLWFPVRLQRALFPPGAGPGREQRRHHRRDRAAVGTSTARERGTELIGSDGLGRIDRTAWLRRRLAPVRLLLPLGWLLATVGYFGPWIAHETAALTLSGVDLGEFVKFLPVGESVRVVRQLFYLPPLAVVVSIALLIGSRRLGFPWLLRLLLLLLAVPVSQQLLPPAWSPGSLLTAEFRLQTLALAACWLLLAGFWLLGRLPPRLAGVLSAALALAATILPAWQFLTIKPAIDAVYGTPPAAGWGFFVCLAGLVAVAAAGIVLVLRGQARSVSPW